MDAIIEFLFVDAHCFFRKFNGVMYQVVKANFLLGANVIVAYATYRIVRRLKEML